VYDAIDTHIENKQWSYAWNAIADAINSYEDTKLRVYNCLWLHQKGAKLGSHVGQYEIALGMAEKFVVQGQKLLNWVHICKPSNSGVLRSAHLVKTKLTQ